MKLTDNKTPDHKVYPQFIKNAPKTVERTYGDGVYDRKVCYQANYHHGSDARRLWKKLKGYHLRSLAETGMYRFKVLFGGDLKCRTFQRQQSEVYVKAKALNIMTSLGMPQSVRKAA